MLAVPWTTRWTAKVAKPRELGRVSKQCTRMYPEGMDYQNVPEYPEGMDFEVAREIETEGDMFEEEHWDFNSQKWGMKPTV